MGKIHTLLASLIITLLIFLATSCNNSGGAIPVTNTVFLGTYYGSLVGQGYNNPDTIVISAGSSSTSVVLNARSVSGTSYTLYGTVNGVNTFILPPQQVYFATPNTTYDSVSGTGTLNNSALLVNYSFASTSGGYISWVFSGNLH